MSKNTVDLANKRFGRLIAIQVSGRLHRSVAWLCVCDCGKQCRVTGSNLRKGATRSCGCLRKETYVATMHAGRDRARAHRGPTIGVAVRDAAKREAAFDSVFAPKREIVRDGDKTWAKAEDALGAIAKAW